MARSVMTILAASLLLACSGKAPQSSMGANGIPRLGFERFRLDNGLEVIVVEDRRLPLVAVNLWYHVGPANERPGRTGFAHLFEHMMFEGSRHVGADRHFPLLEAAGATSVNGTTDFDRTNYFETVPSSELELALWIESDRMGFLLDTLDQAALTGQIDVVRNERRQSVEGVPYGIVEEEVWHQLFPKGHPYHASVIGSHADIESASLDDVRQFFRDYYTPNNASLAIVGDVDTQKVRALVERYFGPIPAGKVQPRPVPQPTTVTREKRVQVTDKVELPRLYMAWQTPVIYDTGDADADLLARILGGGKSSRLYRKLVYELQIAQDVEVWQKSLALGSVFTISATAKPGVPLAKLEQVIDAELADIQERGPAADELQRAQNMIETGLITSLETLGGLGGVADRLNQYNHYVHDPDFLRTDIERYRKATPVSVRLLARRLKRDARVVVEGVPGQKVLDDVPRRQPEASAAAPAASAAPAAASVTTDDWRAQRPSAGPVGTLQLPAAQRFMLPNGLTVFLLEQHQLPVLSARLVVLHGSGANPAGLPGLAAFTADMLDEGTTRRPALQLAAELDRLGASLHVASSTDSISLNLGVLRKNVDPAFELLADAALHPAFDEREVARVRNNRLTDYQQDADDPDALAVRAFDRALYGASHPYGYTEAGSAASLAAISRADLQQFWQAGFVPPRAALVVSGAITADELRALAAKHFGAWTGSGEPLPPPAAPAAAAPRRVLLVDKPRAPQSSLAIGRVGVPRSSPDYLALEVMNNVLGGLFSSRINLNLREQHGYSYGAFSGFAFRRGLGPFLVDGSVRSDATADAVREVFHEFDRMRNEPVTPAELALARDSWTRSLAAYFETTAQSVGSVAQLFMYGLPQDYYVSLPSGINRIDAADVQRVARQYLDPAQMTVVVVGDRRTVEKGLAALKLGPVELRDNEGRPLR